ncbi:carbohydrate ABC transporter permease [Gracilibacillus phocaeensis]|uniref:carbohydrate ABC transporter permease n=1 Tax=Gracilibacillus phocaeensis TaxID=2042304 RepID=UPI0010307826|nr:carbohydrate ABC transporter permease [Gracilibacillus phocaeensis]
MRNKRRFNTILLFIVSTILFVLFVFPFFLVVINSLKDRTNIIQNPLSFMGELSFDNYIQAYETMNFASALWNSLLVTIVSVIVVIIFSAMLAYYLVRWKSRLNTFIFSLLIASMIIPFQAIMIPFVSFFGDLNMLNSPFVLIFFYLGFGVSLATFMYHGFIKGIPKELEEAAFIDGASRLQVFLRVIFPMLKPITATIAILDVLWVWNDFLLPSLVLTSAENRTIPLSTYYFFGRYTADYGAAMAALVLAIIPIVIFYLILQKQIIKGVVDGAIK